ncbi:pantetheine-phosphate adenylyltransferase [Salipaludibacillus sp. LMS25]|uniref:pantetheine-phosphate adenylyltransferase n=1 Tax=Salipaludibacillus sp. LMS25 TaxID=2924031 RepID=UPI0020CFF573|nr:pantetheine-phosphate adenylyltransferase [Salipaludibacillus sp. LMS25]UTR16915.1 pantetheine-phosphate adenylyltransferase [Salipaludibacillus sp. LMS25]
MMRNAVVPGSFDPVTLGHLDVISRSSKMFDRVIVAVLHNQQKKPLFSVKERMQLIEESTSTLKNVEVASFNGLLMDFASEHKASVIIKGLRTVADFEYELQMATVNRQLNENVDTFFIMTAANYAHLSSSIVKEVAKYQADLTSMVSLPVERALREKFN